MISLEPGRFSEMYKSGSEMEKEAILGAIGGFAARAAPKIWKALKFAWRPFGRKAAKGVPQTLRRTRSAANTAWQAGVAFPAAFSGISAGTGGGSAARSAGAVQRGRAIRQATSLYPQIPKAASEEEI
jgi:hypothetical protein